MRQPRGCGALRLQSRTGSASSTPLSDLGLLLRLWLQSLRCVRKGPAVCPARGEDFVDSQSGLPRQLSWVSLLCVRLRGPCGDEV